MKIENRALGIGATLGVIKTDKFKNNYFALNFLLPLNDENIAKCNVLSSVLLRGTSKHPSVSSMSKHIGMLYDPSFEVSATKTSSSLVFKIGAYYLENDFLPKEEKMDVFSEITAFMFEILKEPFLGNGEFSSFYTESEKKHQIDKIKAKINNKDSYALSRANTLMLGNIPAACESLGTEEEVNAITPGSLYKMLVYILQKCPLEAVFAGRFTVKTEETVLKFISALLNGRKEEDLIPVADCIKPSFDGKVKDIKEDICATQGRMVMGFSMPDTGEKTANTEVFNEIFGGSAVSRLFTNVRERLQLCYYCASAQNLSLNVMYVRSGINRDKVDIAKEEIMRQLDLLKNPQNISESELSAAKLGIVSNYNAICDSVVRYASWYINRRISGKHTDVERCIEEINKVSAEDVSEIANGAALTITYFLNCIEG